MSTNICKNCLTTLLISAFALQLQAATINVSGIVTDNNNIPLPYAHIVIGSINIGATTDVNGFYSLNVPQGDYTLTVSYLGYKNNEVRLSVKDEPVVLNIKLVENAIEFEEVVIYGQLTRGQAKALNTQRLSGNIKNIVDVEQFSQYPDLSAAETVQRLPGISITRDQGEGEFVQIRGVSEQLNSLTMNGQKLPSVEPDAGRTVGLDLIQSSLIQSIEVTKALTPDMEADAIGGTVDFKLREAAKKTILEFSAGYGANQQESEYENWGRDIVSLSSIAAKRFAKNKIGVMLASSYYNTDKGSMFNSRSFTSLEENTLNIRRTTDYDVKRERLGVIANIDITPNQFNKWIITSNYNRYKDNEIRQQARYTWDNNREERRTRNRLEDQKVFFNMLSGEHKFNDIKANYVLSYSIGNEDLPDRTEWRYRRTVEALSELDRDGQDNLSANSTFGDPDPLVFNRVDYVPRYTEESNFTGGLDIEIPLMQNNKSKLKVGGKYRKLAREYRDGEFRPKPIEGSYIRDFQEGEFPFPDLRFTDSEFNNLGFDLSKNDINYEDLTGYNATETVLAGYLMNTTKWTDKLTSIIGVRIENTATDYTSTENDFKGEGEYVNILPSVHFTNKIDKNNQLRLAYSTGLSRPEYTLLVPYESIGSDEIRRGNENLEAVNAHNFDIMYERYMDNLDYFTFGAFAKILKNQIVTEQVGTENGLPVFSPVNGASASVYGFEASANKRIFASFPLSVNANYTFTETQADYGDDRDDLPLVNSPKHMGNLSLLYNNDRLGFFAVIGGTYRHFVFNKFEDTDDAVDGNENIWLDKTIHIDMSVGYNLNKKLSIKFQLNNLTNQANTEVTGKPNEEYSKWSETESYGISGLFVVAYKLSVVSD